MNIIDKWKASLKKNRGLTIVLTLIVLFILLALANQARAATYDLTCTPPQSRTDNTPFDPATELQEYRWYVDGAFVGTSTTCAYSLNTADGTYTVTATSVDTGGREGPQSPGKSVTLTTAPPNPPTLQ